MTNANKISKSSKVSSHRFISEKHLKSMALIPRMDVWHLLIVLIFGLTYLDDHAVVVVHAAFVASSSPVLLTSSSEVDAVARQKKTSSFVLQHLCSANSDAVVEEIKNDESSSSSSSSIVDVVLFGVGDLRLDDHIGLIRAIENQQQNGNSSSNNNKILPLCILKDENLVSIPGAVAHTLDTAYMLSAALKDLQDALQRDLGLPLHVVWNTKQNQQSMAEIISELIVKDAVDDDDDDDDVNATIRIHVCDLGEADNQLAYGPYSQLPKMIDDNKGKIKKHIEIVTWTNDLRPQPWSKVDSLPRTFPDYQRLYENVQLVTKPKSPPSSTLQPLKLVSINGDLTAAIPTAEQLTAHLTKLLQLDVARVMAEANTGLYKTHWGGLQAETIGCRSALDIVMAYVKECQEKDGVWTMHPLKPGATRNAYSLEHAAMHWQLQGLGKKQTEGAVYAENWMAGEAMVRYLAAPLLFGTISPRRLHDMGLDNKIYYQSPLKIMVEAREWHRLLAAHHIRNIPAYQVTTSSSSSTGKTTAANQEETTAAKTQYRYWRYHGFLCRYAVTDPPSHLSSKNVEKEGLLMVHGFGASGSQWNKMLQEFLNTHADSGNVQQQGLAPDLLGFGESEKPALSYTGYMWDSQVLDFAKEQVLNRNHHGCKSFITGGNSIGGFTSMQFAACDTASIKTNLDDDGSSSSRVTAVSSSGAPGTALCTGLVLMNSAGPIFTRQEMDEVVQDDSTTTTNSLQKCSVAQITAMDALPACSPPPRPVMRAIGNGLLAYLRPSVQSICKNLYPTNPAAVDDVLCQGILRDSLDPGAIYVMMAGAKLPMPRSANELLNADFRPGKTLSTSSAIAESTFDGPVLVAQGILDPLSDCDDRMKRFGALRKGIDMDPIDAGHCPHDELPNQVAGSISKWMLATKEQRRAFIKTSTTAGVATPVVASS